MENNIEIIKHKIIVIQSLKYPYKETGRDLYNNILRYKQYYKNDCSSEFYAIDNKQSFLNTLKEIEKNIADGELITLHFETHGSHDGVHLNSEEFVTWEEFDDAVRPINIKTCNLLVVSMAMCYGGALLSHINPDKRAPYLCFIGSYRELLEEEIIEGYHMFYESYSSPLDISTAYKSLISIYEENKNPYGLFTQEFIFDETFNPDRDPANFKGLVEMQCFKKFGDLNPNNIQLMECDLREFFSNVKETKRDFFLFKDVINNDKIES
jgi:hypothetical protein